ncbi:MAG: hypothetical protein VZR56_11270 [Treponema sp.]|nr:hypothetical protein [Treponema sp.]MEE3314720.1 hypothetical protein [Treponema sp.]
MKKKFLAVLASLFVFGSVSAFAFDWSQCWCNYGGGIEKGDLILNVDVGFGGLFWDYYELGSDYKGSWFFPYTEASLSYATYIWKLPFTFGGYVGFDGYHYEHKYSDHEWTHMTLYTGGLVEYHVQLPPKGLDVYAGTKLGVGIKLADYSGSRVYFEGDGYLGANWFFSDFFGVNLELGGPNVYAKTGLTFKF